MARLEDVQQEPLSVDPASAAVISYPASHQHSASLSDVRRAIGMSFVSESRFPKLL